MATRRGSGNGDAIRIAEWCQQARMMEALSRIGEGAPVTAAAFEVGYSSASAFNAAFRRVFGCPPTHY